MRTLLSFILSWLLPSNGKRRATAEQTSLVTTPDTADAPTTTLRMVGVERPSHRDYLRGEDVALIRPYLIAWEQEQERRRQKDRRTAATLATLGIDFPTPAHGATA